MQGQVIEIPLRASAPTHKIVAEGDLDIGVIAQEQETVRKVLLRNEGPRDAGLSISYDKSVPGLTGEPPRELCRGQCPAPVACQRPSPRLPPQSS